VFQNRYRGPPMRVFEPKDVITLFRSEVQKAGSISAWARKTSINRTAVSEALQSKKPISKSAPRTRAPKGAIFD